MASPITVPRGRSPAPLPSPHQPAAPVGPSGFRARGGEGGAGSPTTAPPPPPLSTFPNLLMLVDRTSFDETESFGVDAIALESSSYNDSRINAPPSQGVIMRNGKVRRRLKWRPKSMMKTKRKHPHQLPLSPSSLMLPPSPPSSMQLSRGRSSPSSSSSPSWTESSSSNRQLTSGVERGGIPDVVMKKHQPSSQPPRRNRTSSSTSSSNASVNSSSNASDASKQSRRSHHSFASVETQVKSNTTKSLALRAGAPSFLLKHQRSAGSSVASSSVTRGNRKFPLPPRPSHDYSTTLDGVPTHDTSSSASASSTSTDNTGTTTASTAATSATTTTTISNEGQVIMMRVDSTGSSEVASMSSHHLHHLHHQRHDATVFEAADSVLEDADEKKEEEGDSMAGPRDTVAPKPPSSRGSLFLSPSASSATSSSSFRPPLFKSKSTTSGRGGSRKSLAKANPSTAQPASFPRSSSVPKQLDPTPTSSVTFPSAAASSSPDAQDSAPPGTLLNSMPTLSGEEVERERRVDLRIRQSPSSMSDRSSSLRGSTPPPPASYVATQLSRSDSSPRSGTLAGNVHLVPEDQEGTSIEVVNDPTSLTPEVITEQASPPRNAAGAVSAARQAYSLIRTASSRLSTRSQRSLASSKKNVDPVIGPSFSTRAVLDEADLDTESLAPSLDGDESTWQPRSRPNPVLANSTSRQSPTNAPIPEIRFPVPDLAPTTETGWNQEPTSAAIPPNHVENDRDSPPLARLRNSIESAAPTSVSPRTVPTVPVDLDDCSFLEAEKNLQAIHDMAVEHLQQGEYDEALEVFEEILRGQLTRYGTDHFRVATALHNVGIVNMRRGDYARAAHAYREAIAIRRRALSPDHPDVAASLAQLGVAYLERRQHKKAIAAFREALKIRRQCLGSTHPKVAKLLNNIGCALYELNALDVAQVAFEEALDIQRMNLRQEPALCQATSNFSLLSLASTLCNIASIKLYFGRTDEASVDFQEALLVQQCVFGDDHPIPRQTEESLRWIESSRGRNQQPGQGDDAQDSDSSYQGNLGILSRLFRRSGTGGGGGGESEAWPRADECARFDTSSQSIHPSLLSCAVRDDAREVFGTVEERLMRLQDKIERACGPPAPSAYGYDDDSHAYDDDDDEDDEGYDSDFDIVDEDFVNVGSAGRRRVIDV